MAARDSGHRVTIPVVLEVCRCGQALRPEDVGLSPFVYDPAGAAQAPAVVVSTPGEVQHKPGADGRGGLSAER